MIVLVMALAYLLVVVFDVSLSRTRARPAVETRDVGPAPAEAQHVHVVPRQGDPADQPVLERRPEPVPEPEPEAPPAPEPLPPAAELGEKLPKLVAVPKPAAELEPEPGPEPESQPERVVTLPVAQTPREWNVWELERLAREHSGDDAKDEERASLLVYLREFATPEGTLPVDFDALVREAFGELLNSAR